MEKPLFDASIIAGLVSARALPNYVHDWAAFLAFAGDEALEPEKFAGWRSHLVQKTEYSPNTINRMMTSVRRVVEEAAIRGFVSAGVYGGFKLVKSVSELSLKHRLKPNNRTKITPGDMRRLCDAPDAGTLLGLRDRALLLTLATSGARIGEVVALTVDHVRHGEQYYMLVNGKRDVDWRQVPLTREAYWAIQAWLEKRGKLSKYVFTSFSGRGERLTSDPLSTTSAWRLVQKYAEQVELEHVKPHDFRRFVGTQLAKENPRQAQKALGHKKMATTFDNYVLDELEPGLTEGMF